MRSLSNLCALLVASLLTCDAFHVHVACRRAGVQSRAGRPAAEEPSWIEKLKYGRRGKVARQAPLPPPPPRAPSRYVPPELWQDNNTTSAELKWQERVQFDAQRQGNRLRQNDVLRNELGKG